IAALFPAEFQLQPSAVWWGQRSCSYPGSAWWWSQKLILTILLVPVLGLFFEKQAQNSFRGSCVFYLVHPLDKVSSKSQSFTDSISTMVKKLCRLYGFQILFEFFL